jgi:hypothetical protein
MAARRRPVVARSGVACTSSRSRAHVHRGRHPASAPHQSKDGGGELRAARVGDTAEVTTALRARAVAVPLRHDASPEP